jgi:outer membrane protein assembly factor BamD
MVKQRQRRWPLLLVLALLAVGAGCASTKKKDDKLLQQLANLDKKTIFDRAEELYSKEKYGEARDHYSFLYDTFPNDPLGHKAALRIADTYAVKKDSTAQTEARLRYRDFANRYPNDPDRAYALLHLGQTYTTGRLRPDRDLAQLHEALDAYQQVINLYPSSPYVGEAREKTAALRELLAEHEWLVARFYYRNRRLRGALGRLEQLKEKYPEFSKMAQVDELIAELKPAVEKIDKMLRPEPNVEKPEQTLTRPSGVG